MKPKICENTAKTRRFRGNPKSRGIAANSGELRAINYTLLHWGGISRPALRATAWRSVGLFPARHSGNRPVSVALLHKPREPACSPIHRSFPLTEHGGLPATRPRLNAVDLHVTVLYGTGRGSTKRCNLPVRFSQDSILASARISLGAGKR
jgi:hypothetical protein